MENRLLAFEQSLANFSFCIAADFHDLGKKCLALERKKASDLEEWRRRVEQQHEDEQTNNGIAQNGMSTIDASRTEALREKIQKHKEDMQNRAASQGESAPILYPPEVSKFVFDKFVAEIQPQVIAKYPNVPMFKVNRVVLQKWKSLDPVKKGMFISKWSSREAEFEQKKLEESNVEEVFVKQEAPEPEYYAQKIEFNANGHEAANELEEEANPER